MWKILNKMGDFLQSDEQTIWSLIMRNKSVVIDKMQLQN